MAWKLHPISSEIDIASFDCGEKSLDKFLQRHALGNHRAGIGRTYIATEEGQFLAAGYFTVSSTSVEFEVIPDFIRKRLPKYPIAMAHLGRLAVDHRFQGIGLGEGLLLEAFRKIVNASYYVGVYGIDVLALHERAKAFYVKFGFIEMLDQPLHLFLPIATARETVGMAEE